MPRRILAAGALLAVLLGSSGCAGLRADSTGQEGSAQVAAAKKAPRRIVLPPNPKVYFFGDSWTRGSSADPGRGFPQVVGETLGWQVELGPDNSGAGFVHTFDPDRALFLESAKAIDHIDADLIVLEGGLNDGPGPLDDFWRRVSRTVKTLRAKADGAPLVLVGPLSPDGTVPEGLSAIDYLEDGAAEQLDVHYISPIQEGWFNPDNVGGLVDPETIHPNTAGHAYYAGRLAADLARITKTKAPRPTVG